MGRLTSKTKTMVVEEDEDEDMLEARTCVRMQQRRNCCSTRRRQRRRVDLVESGVDACTSEG